MKLSLGVQGYIGDMEVEGVHERKKTPKTMREKEGQKEGVDAGRASPGVPGGQSTAEPHGPARPRQTPAYQLSWLAGDCPILNPTALASMQT